MGKKIVSRKSKGGENPLLLPSSREQGGLEGKSAQDLVLSSAGRQLYKYDLPALERGFGDLLDSHDGEGTFPYAAITTDQTEDYNSRMRRLVNLQPRINIRRMNLPDHISLKMYKEVEDFPLSEMLNLEQGKKNVKGMDYILIKRVSIIFSPLSSFVDCHSDVLVTLVDMRKRSGQVARSLVLQDNKQYKGEYTLDYCFPRSSAQKLSMSFAQEIPTFDTGEQWGACQIFLDLEESDYPQMVAFQDTIGMASLTHSALETYKHNPAHLDLAIRDSHRSRLQEMFLQGQIADETEPKINKTGKTTYARSSATSLKQVNRTARVVPVDSHGEVDWTSVNQFNQGQIPEDQMSIEPEGEVESSQHVFQQHAMNKTEGKPLRSALKRTRAHFSPTPSSPTIEEVAEESSIPQNPESMVAQELPLSQNLTEENLGILIQTGRLNKTVLRE